MGQREAIAQYLVSGGLIIPVVLLVGTAEILGRAAVPFAVAMMWLGFAALVIAKCPLSRREFWLSFGPKHLTLGRRRLYWSAYVMLVCGLFLVLLGLAFARLSAQ